MTFEFVIQDIVNTVLKRASAFRRTQSHLLLFKAVLSSLHILIHQEQATSSLPPIFVSAT